MASPPICERYLKDEPVKACPPSALYRFRKFARRNKRILATAGVIVLALVLGTAVSTWQAIRATAAEGLAQKRLASESEARNATRDQLRLTEQAQGQAMHRLYDARLAQARAGSLSRRVGQRFDSLGAMAQALKIARDPPSWAKNAGSNSATRPSPAWRCPICGSPRCGTVGPPASETSISMAPWSDMPAWTSRETSRSTGSRTTPKSAASREWDREKPGRRSAPTASS